MGKRQKDMCHFSYWRARERNLISSKSRDKRTYVWKKLTWACVLLAIREQERQIQNPRVLSLSSKSGDKRKKKVRCFHFVDGYDGVPKTSGLENLGFVFKMY